MRPYTLTAEAPVEDTGSPWVYEGPNEGKEPECATLIYCHPDDETIFAAGLMLANPEWEWTLLRMTGDNEPVRDAEHECAVELLRAEGVNIVQAHSFNGTDEPLPWVGRATWAAALAQMRGDADVVFTHGARGEYGHPHHIALHHIVHTLYDNVWYFFNPGCERDPQLLMGYVRIVPTTARKRWIMEHAYESTWRAVSAGAPELVESQFTGKPEFFTR